MKVPIFVFSFLILALNIRAQEAIYGDQFDSGVLPVSEATGYQVSLENEAFRITGTGSAPPWSAMRYDFHDGSGREIVVNAATTPKLYIKAKGENSPNLRIDFQDNSGYVTNQNATIVTLENDYKIYELDYTDRLLDGAYGGPCMTAPCVVDASNEVTINWNAPLAYAINALRFYQNQGTGIGTSIQENYRSSWKIAPNPVANQLQIISSTFINKPMPYQISSISGQIISNGRIMASEPIDVRSMVPGLYIFTVFEAGSPIPLKFIKQ